MTLDTDEIGDQPGNLGFRSVLRYVDDTSSLRRAFWNHRRRRIQHLFDGGTSEEEERSALRVLERADSGAEANHYIAHFGWERFDDDLVETQVTEWAQHVGTQHAQDAHWVARFVLWSIGSIAGMPLEDQIAKYRGTWGSLSLGRRQQIAGWLIQQRAMLVGVGVRMDFIGRPSRLDTFHGIVQVAAADDTVTSDDLRFVEWQAFYARRFAQQLRDGEVRTLVTTLVDLVDPDLPDIRRHALFDLYQGLFLPTILALRDVIDVLGSADQRQRFARFLEARTVFVDEFPQTDPPPTLIREIARALGVVADSIDALTTVLANMADTIASINIDSLLNDSADDDARAAINRLGQANRLQWLPMNLRADLCRRCLDGTTDDDDEDAILRTLTHTWPDSLCERYLLVSNLTWEALDTSIDGDQRDDLAALLSRV